RIAILDPELSLSMPKHVAACTGLDAIGHAVETAVTSAGTEESRALSLQAFALANDAFPTVLSQPEDLNARANMLRAACIAGRAIEASMLGAAHSIANPLTKHFDMPHGQAVATALPHVIRYNAQDSTAAASYHALAVAGGLAAQETSEAEACEALAVRMEQLLELAGLPSPLTAAVVDENKLTALAEEASTQWTARFNPRSIDTGAFRELFRLLV
ncbi:MAG: alcohol dehydrogenase, partial [Planctomycetota bacterium]